jgi:hypothetical protein
LSDFTVESAVALMCGHPVCLGCQNKLRENYKNQCPECRRVIPLCVDTSNATRIQFIPERVGPPTPPAAAAVATAAESPAMVSESNTTQLVVPEITLSDAVCARKIVLILDVSGSMGGASSPIKSIDPPTRISLLAHLAKQYAQVAKNLNLSMEFWTFSEDVRCLSPQIKPGMSDADYSNLVSKLQNLKPEDNTYMIPALEQAWAKNRDNAVYILFTDGEPSERPIVSVLNCIRDTFSNTWLNLVAFGSNLNEDLMKAVGQLGSRNVVSYIYDARGAASYMSCLLAHILNDGEKATLTPQETEFQKTFEILMQSKYVTNNGWDRRTTFETALVHFYNSNKSASAADAPDGFIKALLMDINERTDDHGQLVLALQQIQSQNIDCYGKWGRSYLLAFFFSAVRNMVPYNNFDCTTRFLRTPAFTEKYNFVIKIMKSIVFKQVNSEQQAAKISEQQRAREADMERERQRQRQRDEEERLRNRQRAASPPPSMSYDNWSSRDWDDGCLRGDALVLTRNRGWVRLDELTYGDVVTYTILNGNNLEVFASEVDCVVVIKGQKDVHMRGPATPDHPMFDFPFDKWSTCEAVYKDRWAEEISPTLDLYNVLLKKRDVHLLIKYNDVPYVLAASLGNVCGSICHPLYSTNKVIQQIESHPDYKTGKIVLNSESVVRDDKGLVCRLY